MRKCDEVEEGLAGLPLTVSMGRVEKLVKVQQYQEEIMSQYHRYVVDELNDWAIMEAGEIMRSGMEDLVQFATEEADVYKRQVYSREGTFEAWSGGEEPKRRQVRSLSRLRCPCCRYSKFGAFVFERSI